MPLPLSPTTKKLNFGARSTTTGGRKALKSFSKVIPPSLLLLLCLAFVLLRVGPSALNVTTVVKTQKKIVLPLEEAKRISQHVRQADQFAIQPEVLAHLETLSDFPKIVHVIFPDKDILDKDFEMIEHGIGRIRDMNPDWKILVHDNDDMIETIKNFEPPASGGVAGEEWFPESMRQQLLEGHVIERADAFREIIVYTMGGYYLDMDRVANIPFSEVFDTSHVKLVMPTCYDINFAQDQYGSAPKNDMVMNIFRSQCEKRKNYPRKKGWLNSSHTMELGTTLTFSLWRDLFGFDFHGKEYSKFENGNVEGLWNETRRLLKERSGGLIVTRKEQWCDGLLVRAYDGCRAVSRVPLYEHYNISDWAPQVDALWNENKTS